MHFVLSLQDAGIRHSDNLRPRRATSSSGKNPDSWGPSHTFVGYKIEESSSKLAAQVMACISSLIISDRVIPNSAVLIAPARVIIIFLLYQDALHMIQPHQQERRN